MNNRNTLVIISLTLALLMVLGVISVFSFFPNTSEKETVTAKPVSFPLLGNKVSNVSTKNPKVPSTTVSDVVEIKTSTGVISVKDFTKLSDVTKSLSADHFYVLYPADSNKALEYEINYLVSDSRFLIVLGKEPLGEVRRRAADDLKNRLGVSDSELCTLVVNVQTPRWVSDFYAGKNLGLPNCPGATKFDGD